MGSGGRERFNEPREGQLPISIRGSTTVVREEKGRNSFLKGFLGTAGRPEGEEVRGEWVIRTGTGQQVWVHVGVLGGGGVEGTDRGSMGKKKRAAFGDRFGRQSPRGQTAEH